MKIDVLLRTRDFDADYRWFYRPDYVDEVMEDKMAFLVQMMQKSSLKTYLTEESLHNIFYIYDANGSVLVRSGFSGSQDRHGRAIYSVEGLACPPEQNRIFWYALPYLIDRLQQNPLLRDRWVNGQQDTQRTKARQINLEELTEDSLFAALEEEGSLWQQMKDHSPCMERLFRDVQASSEMYNLVYGTLSQSFYERSAGRCYTPDAYAAQPPVPVRALETELHPVIDAAGSAYQTQLQIEQLGKRYSLFLLAADASGEGLGETDPMSFGREGIDLAQIEKARIALDRELGTMGYHRRRIR